MKKGFSQEGLKLIACITMLIDHIGHKIVLPLYTHFANLYGSMSASAEQLYALYYLLRCIGRISFPIFCFLLVEGFSRTHSRRNYGLRLAVGAVLAEIPYNLFLSGSVFCTKQSVMITLLLGFFMLLAMEKCQSLTWKPMVVIPFAILAELLRSDYGWLGIALIGILELSRYLYPQNLIRFCGMLILFHYAQGKVFWIGNFSLPMQVLGALSILFIGNYDGRKVSGRKGLQWAFYLFYPAHLLLLCLIHALLPLGLPV